MLEISKSESCCISCGDKNKSTRKISINRDNGTYKGANIVSFSLCNDCFITLAREFRKFS